MADTSQGDGWWQASDTKWYPPQPPAQAAPAPPPVQPAGAPCAVCGAHALASREKTLTTKKRVKFGLFWIIISIFSLGLAVIVWLILPRKNEVIGVDRYMECQSCHARQP